MQTQGKSALAGVRSLAQGCSRKRKDTPSLPWKLPGHVPPNSCPRNRPAHGPRKSPTASTEQSKGHGDRSPSPWGSSRGQSPGSQGLKGASPAIAPGVPTSVPHRSSCSGLGTLWPSPGLGSRMIFLSLWTNILSGLPSQPAGSREHCAML